ncbi:MAG: hypothetical protein EXS14_10395 [Planctomycetes bacterium]|nr:hypothetical protein [Planctomycetota bacterium]
MMRLSVLLLLALGAAGCVALGGDEPTPDAERIPAAWRSPTIDGHKIRRVVVVPFQDLSGHPIEARAIMQGVVDEIQRRQPFEIFHADSKTLSNEEEDRYLHSGTIDKEALVRVSQEHHADAVLYGVVTRYRAYEPMLLGMQLNLVSTGAGDIVWSTSALFDASDARCAADVHNWHDTSLDHAADTMNGWRTILLSPARFTAYACARMVATW